MVEKLNDIIKDRYGKGFSVRQLSDIDGLSTTESTIHGQDLYIPIVVKELFLGFGLVYQANDLTDGQQLHLAKLVKMILEPALYSQHLERTLHNMEIEKSISYSDQKSKIKYTFIFGSHATLIQKISMKLHELSQNWSYLPFTDIQSTMLKASEFSELDNTTLVVNLENKISIDKQKLLVDYMQSGSPGSLLIFVSSRPSSLLLKSGLVENDLYELIKASEFSVDRLPVERQALNDVLEMLYFPS